MDELSPAIQKRIQRLEDQVGRDPSSPVFVSLAEEYRKAGEAEEAERVLRDGLARRPAHHSARAALGRILVEVGRVQEARAELERVLQAVPDNLLARRLLERLEGGGTAPEGGDQDRTTLPMDASVPPPAPPQPPATGTRPPGPEVRSEALAGRDEGPGARDRALEIYPELLGRDPSDPRWKEAVAHLDRRGAVPPEPAGISASPPAPPARETGPEPLPAEVWEEQPGAPSRDAADAPGDEAIRTLQVRTEEIEPRAPSPEVDGRALRLAALQRYLDRVRAHVGGPYSGAPGGPA